MTEITNLIDVPLIGGGEDLLKINKYVSALKKYINIATMPTTIAIQGEWGSGKTSLMNQIRYDLCDEQETTELDAPFHGVWLNMWEYSMMKTPEEVLINVIKGLTTECSRLLERHNKKSEAVEQLKSQALSFLKKTASFAAKTALKAGVNAVGLDGDAAVSAIVEGVGGGTEKLEDEIRPSQFRNSLQKVIDECLDIDHKNGDTKKKGFLFFIDDLDRINPIEAVHILELLKNLFEVKNCIFVLAIDYEVVVKGLKAKFGEGKQDDRAYRSFFDKIIQLPFSMPISAYNISNFLKNSLTNLNFMSESEMNEDVTLEDDEKLTYLECLQNFVYWSTGANPRAIKRLLNSLLLIQIMQEDDADENTAQYKEPYVKAINFAFVCMQIAYPEVYDCLLKDNNFLEWDEESAHEFHVKKIEDEKLAELGYLKEFDEEWERVLYRICQKTTFLAGRAQNISRLLNTIRYLIPEDKDFGEAITSIIELSAVTTVSSVDSSLREKGKQPKVIRKGDDLISAVIKKIVSEKTDEGVLLQGVGLGGSKSRIPIISNSLYKYGIRCGIKYNAFANKELVNKINFQIQVFISKALLKNDPSVIPYYESLFKIFGKKLNIDSISEQLKYGEFKKSVEILEYPEAEEQTDEIIYTKIKSFIDKCLVSVENEVDKYRDDLEHITEYQHEYIKLLKGRHSGNEASNNDPNYIAEDDGGWWHWFY